MTPRTPLCCSYDAGGIETQAIKLGDGSFKIIVQAQEVRPMVLHWAQNEWELPDPAYWPPGTNKACFRGGAWRAHLAPATARGGGGEGGGCSLQCKALWV